MERKISYIELFPERLYLVGGMLPLNGRITWVPPEAKGYQPSNTYLLRLDDGDVLVDPGISYVRKEVMSGLAQILSPGSSLRVFLTRAQLDSIGNLGEIAAVYRIEQIFTGGVSNPFDQFDAATSTDKEGRAKGIDVVRSNTYEPPLEVFSSAIRILSTYWGYDKTTRTVFTSDCFTHATLNGSGERPVIDAFGVDSYTIDEVRDHLFASMWWLPFADQKELIVEQLRGFFETHPVEIIAPSRGCVLKGEDIVRRHIDMLTDVLLGTTERVSS